MRNKTKTISLSGLTISKQPPWIAASPDGMVTDSSHTPSEGLVELKNPSCVQDITIAEACEMKRILPKTKTGNYTTRQKP